MLAALLAIVMSNSALSGFYDRLIHTPVSIRFGDVGLSKQLLHWINDGLMAVFFFLVGLEIKRELMGGQLSTKEHALLPVIAAVGGMAVPALIYYLINQGHPENLHGWAIPSATDIAFALGILSLLGTRAPVSLKILLTAIAVIDDLGAVVIIALFYTEGLSITALGFSGAAIGLLFLINKLGVRSTAAYIIIGLCLWLAVLKSGVHATLAGVITALFIPYHITEEEARQEKESMLVHMEHALHPWVSFGVMPLFAFANAGLSLHGLSFKNLMEPLTLGIMAGLVFGKQIGVFLPIYAAVKSGISPMPRNASWLQIYALSLFCGIGFTMSLFIGTLAFDDPALASPVRLGVLSGSLVSALAGLFLMYIAHKPHKSITDKKEG